MGTAEAILWLGALIPLILALAALCNIDWGRRGGL